MLRSRLFVSGVATLLGIVALVTGAATPPVNIDRAVAAQQARVSEAPADAAAWNDLGNLLSLAGRGTDAETAYVRAVELAPNDAVARFNLGLLYLDAGKLGRAADQFEDILEVTPDSAWALYQLGVIAQAHGRRDAAISRFARAFALDPTLTFSQNNPHVLDNPWMTESLLRAKEYREASEIEPGRRYGDPVRIAGLLLQGSPEEAALADAGATGGSAATAGATIESPGDRTADSRASRPSAEAPSSEDSRSGDEARPAASDLGGSRIVVGSKDAGSSVFDSSDGAETETASVGEPEARDEGEGSKADAASPRPPRLGSPSRRGRDSGSSAQAPTFVLPPAGGPATAPPTPGSRYRPSRRSTASLEIELLPGSDDPATGVAG